MVFQRYTSNFHFTSVAVREDRTPGGKHKNANLLKLKIPLPEALVEKPEVSSWKPQLIEEFLQVDRSAAVPLFDQVSDTKDFQTDTINQLIQLADWQIGDVLKWFQNLAFLQDVCTEDRKVLVKNSLMELLALGLARRSVDLNDKLMLGQGVYLHHAAASEAGIGDIALRILQLAGKVNELKLDEAEYVCLTIIVLLNPGRC